MILTWFLQKTPRDILQIDALGRQLGNRKLVLSAYKLATKESFGHLLIDLDPRCSELLWLCSKLTDAHTKFYCSEISQIKLELDEYLTSPDYFQTAHRLQTCSEVLCNTSPK